MDQTSPLVSNAISFSWRQLAQRAGVQGGDFDGNGFERLGISVRYGTPCRVTGDRPGIIVVPCGANSWWPLLKKTPHTLDWLPASDVVPSGTQLPFDDPIPVLFWGDRYEQGSKPFAVLRDDGTVVFYADIVATTFFMLSRWEETVVATRDEHGRFPATLSLAHRQGFLDRPVVDEYGLILREWLQVLLPGWQPKPRSFSVKLSHDIDHIHRFPNWYAAIRTLGGDLLKRRSLRRVWQSSFDAVAQMVAPERASYFRSIQALAELSLQHGFNDDAFYFMAAEEGPFQDGYDPASPPVKRCIGELRRQGFEIGFHAGYHTLNDLERLLEEKAHLDAALGATQYGGRQHYLRFQVPDTWRHWEQAGLAYDSTMAYADHEGFRCGTCHPFHPFDMEQNRVLELWEWPLIVMDGALRGHRGLTPQEGEARIQELAQRCRQAEGTFTLLWHNSSLGGEWRPWVEVYRRVIQALAE